MSRNYIKEIQSLRGVAVIMVALFHLNQEIFSYGYLGVDIFFVISGFVITKIIYERSIEGTFVFKNFFVSRFLRLIPALFFMVLIVSFLILLTYQLQANPDSQINTGILSLFGVANYYLLFLKNDYFNSFDESVFEHTWSLSVEFQFYLIYPIFLFFLYRLFKDKLRFYVFSLIFIMSIFLIYNLVNKNEFFYQTEFRIWEFIVGCLTFFLFKKRLLNNNFIIIFSFISLIFFFYSKDLFYLLIFICFLTSFIILNIDKFSVLKLILNNKVLSYVGDISYSIYLWHLPLIFFANTFFIGLDYYFFSIIISLTLSIVSFYFIEKPFRDNQSVRNFFLIKIFTFKKITFLGLLTILSVFYIDKLNLRKEILTNQSKFYAKISKSFELFQGDNLDLNNDKDFTCHEKYDLALLNKNCFKINNSKKLIFFFGDSSMHDYYYSFISSDSKLDQFFSSYNNSSFWKPIFKGYPESGEPHFNMIGKITSFSQIYDQTFLVLSFNHKRNHDLVNRKKSYFVNQKQMYLNLANSLPKNVQIIFIKDTPHFKYGEKQCYILTKHSLSFLGDNKNQNKCDHSIKNISKKMKSINEMFYELNKLDNLMVLDLDSYFCESKICSFYKDVNSQKVAKKIDGTHLTSSLSKNITTFFNKKLNTAINKNLK